MDFGITDTCVYAGISQRTYYYWIEEDEKLLQEIEAAKRFAFLIAKRTVIKGIKDNPCNAFAVDFGVDCFKRLSGKNLSGRI